MTISALPLSYCTNVHPGRTLDEVIANLEKYAVPVAEKFGEPMGVGLWFAESVATELGERPAADELRFPVDGADLRTYTLNAFPYGNFHKDRVKDDVYRPDWTTDARLQYTMICANVLAGIMTADSVGGDADGTISTLPLGFKAHHADDRGFVDRCIEQIIALAGALREIAKARGCVVRLAIEPEPLCVIETTDEAIDFFDRLWDAADAEGTEAGLAVRNHIGLCYDVCHQAVEFEDAARSIVRLHSRGVRINKVQISNAIEVPDPANNHEAHEALRDYVDVRYLHQTFGRMPDGSVHRVTDLTHGFLDDPGPEMLAAESWRIHYHVPVDQHTVGPLNTTRGEVDKALAAIAKLPYAPHLEVETYTWSVLPGDQPDIVEGLAAELKAVRGILDGLK